MRQALTLLSAAVLAMAGTAFAASGSTGLAGVNAALQAGEADRGLSLLNSLPAGDSTSAQAHNLKCRIFFTLETWDAAASECEQAVNLDGGNATYRMWLGRALGEKAGASSFVTAFTLAKRARMEFEEAVRLNPRDAEALADLGEFYSSAPSVVGGGMDKARSVAAELDRVDPVRALELRAGIAKADGDTASAEQSLKQAVAASPHPAFQWMHLASFYRRTKRWPEMENALQSGLAAGLRDKTAGVALFNGGSVLVKANRDSDLAIKLLQAYLAAPTKTEEAPVFVAHVWLARIYADTHNLDAARRERAVALSLASQYKPAQDLKF